jgi:hypothetical protein
MQTKILCTRSALNESIDPASGSRALRRVVDFEVGSVKLGVSIDVSVIEGECRQWTRVSLGSLYAMEWRGRRTLSTSRWPILAWAARLAVEMRVGEVRRLEIERADPVSG